LLGELAVLRDGKASALPPSRKARALLAYLVLSGRTHRRERLCELLWDVADDPRAELRWALTKLRALVDTAGHERLRADRDSVAFVGDGARVDLLWARARAGTAIEQLPTPALREIAAEFRGELLEGLELPDFLDFHAWCIAERESARSLHESVLRALVARLEDEVETAVPYARSLVRVAPLDEAARAHLVRLLAASGRRDEAEQQHDAGLRILAESGVVPSGELASTWRRLTRTKGAAALPTPSSSGAASSSSSSDEVAETGVGGPAAVPSPRLPRGAFPVPATRYARSGDVNVAYQVVGEGPDLVLIPGWVSHVEHAWEVPSFVAFLSRLRSFCRLLIFDRRGTGLSDRVGALPTLEQRMDDIRAVMDAAGSERAALFGISEAGPLAMLFAATYPERTTSLTLYGTFARGSWHRDYPWRWKPEQWDTVLDYIGREWGTGKVACVLAPSIASDPGQIEAWARFERLSVSPGGAQTLFRMTVASDVRHVLPTIHAPTLVLQRTGDRITTPPGARYIAERIAGARYVELPGEDHFPWTGDVEAILGEVQEFVTGHRAAPEPDRVLATVLFVDIVGSTEHVARLGDRAWRDLLARFRALVRKELAGYRGREIDTAGDSFLATFDGPARAVRCARAIRDAVPSLGIAVRAGLHTGECEIFETDVTGIAVHIGARVADAADPGEVLVSSTVKDLVAGSGIAFASRGTHALPGVPGEWALFRAELDG
jgi:class 3 adenylate cyclase/DNA-binding SARP family transcriptional activator